MPRATCRCGQVLSVPVDGPERVICPNCSAKIRVRRSSPKVGSGDGFIRFSCSCGRKLKVRVIAGASMPTAGKCPDCGEIVPIPDEEPKPSSSAEVKAVAAPNFESPTEELSADDMATLERWAQSHAVAAPNGSASFASKPAEPIDETVLPKTLPIHPSPRKVRPATKVEAGLRVCPRCGRPVHLGADACRECGAHVPRR
jgi:hypothetical protein